MVSSFKQFIYLKNCVFLFIILDASLDSVCLGVAGSSQQVSDKTGSLILREMLCTVQYMGATGKYNFGNIGVFLYLIYLRNGF